MTDQVCSFLNQTIANDKVSVRLFLANNEGDGVSQPLEFPTCFWIRGGRKRTCLNNRRRLPPSLRRRRKAVTPPSVSGEELVTFGRRRLASPPSMSAAEEDAHPRQRPELLRNLPLHPPKSHPPHPSIFILPLPRRIDFLFSFILAPPRPSSSSLRLLKPSSHSSARLS